MPAYLDHINWSPIDPRVREAMIPHLSEKYGNPIAFHSAGQKGAAALHRFREKIASFIGASPREIIFTSGSMESDNLAVKGVLTSDDDGQLIASAVEPQSVLQSAIFLERWGYTTALIPVDAHGRIDLSSLDELYTDKARLISVTWVVDGIGTVQPIEDVANWAKDRGIPFHCGGTAASRLFPINVRKMNIDLMTLNANTLGGPPGVGALYVREGIKIQPQIEGGLQERGRRGGMEPLADIAGFAKAAELAAQERDVRLEKLKAMDCYLRESLSDVPDLVIHADGPTRAPGTLSCRAEGIEAEALLMQLDDAEIYASADSPCAGISRKSSHILKAIGLSEEQANSTLSFSLSWETQKSEIDDLITVMKPEIERLRAMSF